MTVAVPKSPPPKPPATFHEAVREWLESPPDQRRPAPVPEAFPEWMTPTSAPEK